MGDQEKARVPLLTHENYEVWSFRMESHLKAKGVWSAVENDPPELERGANAAAVAAHEIKMTSHNEKSYKARDLMIQFCHDDQIVYLKKEKSAKAIWDVLKQEYSYDSIGVQVRIWSEINMMRLAMGGSMRQHLNDLFTLFDRLAQAGEDVKDSMKIGIILSSVNNDEYKSLVTVIQAWGVERLTLVNVKAQLMTEWMKKENAEDSQGSARYGRYGKVGKMRYDRKFNDWNHQKRQENSFKQEYPFKCYECGVEGHIKRNCPTIGNKVLPDLRDVMKNESENKNDQLKSARLARFDKWYMKSFIGMEKENAENCWCIDSGATHHMCGDKDLFYEIDESRCEGNIITANGEKMKIHGVGKVRLTVQDGNTVTPVWLSEVLWIPELECPLISVHKLVDDGKIVEFLRGDCFIRIKNEKMKIAEFDGSIYRLNLVKRCHVAQKVENKKSVELCVHDWHRRMAHRNLDYIRMMEKEGFKIKKCDCSDFCEPCMIGKMSRIPFPKIATPTENVLDVVVSDVCGYMQEKSIGGSRYFVTFIDVHSGYVDIHFLVSKSEVGKTAINYIEWLKTQLNKKPKVFRTDRGLEYMNGHLQSFLAQEGIHAQQTVGYAPQQNGIAERMNRTIVEAARTLLKAAQLPLSLWAEAVHTAVYVFNRMVSVRTGKTPFELLFGKKSSHGPFHEFGCDALVMVPNEKRQKWDDKAERKIFVGYDESAKGYRFISKNFAKEKRIKVMISREARFLDDHLNCGGNLKNSDLKHNVIDSCVLSLDTHNKENEDEGENIPGVEEVKSNSGENGSENSEENCSVDSSADETVEEEYEDAEEEVPIEFNHETVENQNNMEDDVQMNQNLRRSTRSNFGKLPDRLAYKTEMCADDINYEPRTYQDAVKCDEAEKWIEAMEEELKSIDKNETWELCELPRERKAVGSKWVFKIKTEADGQTTRHKARLVAQGYSQKFGIDYDEVFAPVAKGTTFRALMAVAGNRAMKVRHYDVKTAFLNGHLNEEIYLKPPPGFEKGDKVYRLKKSLYGLKQAARVWNETLHKSLVEKGCSQSSEDQCLYIHKHENGRTFILVHVDDMVTVTDDDKSEGEIMNKIGKDFEIKSLGEIKHYLGIDVVKQESGSFEISQPNYIDKIVSAAGLEYSKVSKYPLDKGYYKLEGKLLESNELYRKLIGMLLYVSTNTRPDISASVSILSQRVIEPRDVDLNEVKRVIRYLKGTRNLKLCLSNKNVPEILSGYSDADWAENRRDRKSNTGYFCSLFGGSTSWSCRKQEVVALSTCEAEYIALSETCKEVTWMKRLAEELEIEVPDSITVKTDSQSCISKLANDNSGGRTKHIDTRFHFVKDQIRNGKVKLKYHETSTNIADLFTKPLGRIKLEELRKLAGLNG